MKRPGLVFNEVLASGPVQFGLTGDPRLARSHIADGRRLLGMLRSIYGVNQRIAQGEPGGFYSTSLRFSDGTLIVAVTNDGHDVIRIAAPERRVPVVLSGDETEALRGKRIIKQAPGSASHRSGWSEISSGPAVYRHSAVWDPVNECMYVYGGRPFSNPLTVAENRDVDPGSIVRPAAPGEVFSGNYYTGTSSLYGSFTSSSILWRVQNNFPYWLHYSGVAVGYSVPGGMPYKTPAQQAAARAAVSITQHEYANAMWHEWNSTETFNNSMLIQFNGAFYVSVGTVTGGDDPQTSIDNVGETVWQYAGTTRGFEGRLADWPDATLNDDSFIVSSFPGSYFITVSYSVGPPTYSVVGPTGYSDLDAFARDQIVSISTTFSPQNKGLWKFTYAGGWTALADGPGERAGHTAAWDAVNHRMIIASGYDDTGPLSSFWAYTPATDTWSVLGGDPGVPVENPIVGSRATIYDDVRGNTLGLEDGSSRLFESGILVASPSLSLVSPPPLYGMSFCWDKTNKRGLAYGGSTDNTDPGLLNPGVLWSYDPGLAPARPIDLPDIVIDE